ncbi:MAG: hypothetical protein CVV02_04030 [Firmicutes bacterium HGW-Firmicutes-7]|nr:MAG: hypothetical protein CVV02_04030 [Firmicutes bacterium HGW-Firmicutes-7]
MKRANKDLARISLEIVNIEINDEEIEQLTTGLNFKKIKANAISGIMKENKMKNISRRNRFKKVLVAAVAAVIMVGTVFAAQYVDNFRLFYGDKANIAEEDKTVINETQTVAGVTMNVEEGIIGQKSGVIMVTFEKKDGTTFPKDAVVTALELLPNQEISYMIGQMVTEDGLKLVGRFEVDSNDTLHGKKITVKANRIVEESTQEVITEGPWEISFKLDASKGLITKDIDIKITNQDEIMELKRMDISAVGIEIQGVRLDKNKYELPSYTPVVKITMTDDKVIELKAGSTSEIKTGFKWQYNSDVNYNPVFIDEQNVKSISIDGEVFMIKQ